MLLSPWGGDHSPSWTAGWPHQGVVRALLSEMDLRLSTGNLWKWAAAPSAWNKPPNKKLPSNPFSFHSWDSVTDRAHFQPVWVWVWLWSAFMCCCCSHWSCSSVSIHPSFKCRNIYLAAEAAFLWFAAGEVGSVCVCVLPCVIPGSFMLLFRLALKADGFSFTF